MKRILPVLALGLLITVAISFVKSVQKLWLVDARVAQLKADVKRLEQEKKELSVRNNEAESPEFVEKEAREKLGLGKEGETVVVLPEDTHRSQIQDQNVAGDNDANWRRWLKVFGFVR